MFLTRFRTCLQQYNFNVNYLDLIVLTLTYSVSNIISYCKTSDLFCQNIIFKVKKHHSFIKETSL